MEYTTVNMNGIIFRFPIQDETDFLSLVPCEEIENGLDDSEAAGYWFRQQEELSIMEQAEIFGQNQYQL